MNKDYRDWIDKEYISKSNKKILYYLPEIVECLNDWVLSWPIRPLNNTQNRIVLKSHLIRHLTDKAANGIISKLHCKKIIAKLDEWDFYNLFAKHSDFTEMILEIINKCKGLVL